MKTFRCYNTKLSEVDGWPTSDKKPTIEITDEDNEYCFVIEFGEKPVVTIFDLVDGEIGQVVSETLVER